MNKLLALILILGLPVYMIACPLCFSKKSGVKDPYFHEENIEKHAENFEAE